MSTSQVLSPDPEALRRAAACLADGGLVAFPTETVYGLGADAHNDTAVAKIFAAKGRPSFNPLIVHVANLDHAERLAHFDDDARALANAFWPGPLTLVLPRVTISGLAALVTAELPTVAIRIPAHPVARGLLAAFDGPLAAPSANPSGRVSPTTAQHVVAGLDGKVDGVVDGGPCTVGLESTIIGGAPPALLRPGGISVEAIEAITGPLARAGSKVTAPGQLSKHYAPGVPLRLNAQSARAGEIYVGFGPGPCDLSLSEMGDLTQAATRLFDVLHQLDRLGKPAAVAPIPRTGLGLAINDRLRRAATR